MTILKSREIWQEGLKRFPELRADALQAGIYLRWPFLRGHGLVKEAAVMKKRSRLDEW